MNGKHYHFLSKKEFLELVSGDAFLEYALVYGEYYYGSLKSDVVGKISKGINVLLTIDVQRFLQILGKNMDIGIVSVFIKPEKLEVLEERMGDRGSESDGEMENRLRISENGMSFASR
jgi:guanylate kinase